MKFLRPLSAIAVLLLSCFIVVGNSVAQEQDYFIEIVVSEQSANEYKTAVRLGLGAVIARVAENQVVLNRPEVQAALADSIDYVEQYQYQSLENPEAILRLAKTPSVRKSGEATYILLLQYSEEAIAELLEEEVLQAPSQAVVEGSTMFWMVLESQGRSEIIGGDVQPLIQSRLQELAAQFGLNPVFPVLDLQDYQAIGIADIRGAFADRINNASQRYGTDAVVTGFMSKGDNGIWLTNWRRYASGSSKMFSNNALNLDSVLNGGVEWVAQMAKTYTDGENNSVLSSSSSAFVWFAKVNSTDRYQRVLNLLESLPGVESVTASYLATTGMMFSINPRLSSMQLQQNLSSERWLRQTPPPELLDEGPTIPSGAELFFEYAG